MTHNNGVPAAPPGGSQLWDPGSLPNMSGQGGGGFAGFGANDIIYAYWGDNVVGANAGDGTYIDNTSGDHCTITWFNNRPWSSTPDAFTAQLTLFLDGHVTLCLDNRCDNTSSTFGALTTVIGMSRGGVAIPAESDFNPGPSIAAIATVFEEFTGPGPGTTNTPDPLFDLGNTTLTFLQTGALGWLVTYDTLACASRSTYGAGCDSLALSSTLPILGTNWTLTTTGLSPITPVAITYFGASAVPVGVPLPLIGLNSPGCNVYINGLLGNLSAPNGGGTAALSFPLPLNASLKDAYLTAQSLGLTLAFPSLIGTSNGLEASLGY